MEKVAEITAWLPTMAAKVATTKTGQNTVSAENSSPITLKAINNIDSLLIPEIISCLVWLCRSCPE